VLIQDCRYALRRLSRTPVFSLFAVTILAVGIGLNVAVFALVDAMLWRPAPFADRASLVHIYQDSDAGGPASTAYPAYLDIAAMTDVFAGVAATTSTGANWESPDGPRQVALDFATASYFPVLGLTPQRGQWFASEHDHVGAEMVAVVTDRAWHVRFGADPAIVGRTIRLNNRAVTIIGIGPRGFNGEAGVVATDFWVSISSAGIGGPFQVANLERRQDHWYNVKARLAPGVGVERARAELASLAARHGELYPEIDRGRDITLLTDDEVRMHPQFDSALIAGGIGLFAVAGVVLLLACSNLANLLIVRGLARAPELAIRVALGGDRTRVGRPLLIEALLLSATGGALGLAAATWLQGVVAGIPLPPSNTPLDVRFDYRMVLFSVVAALATGFLFGLLPSRSANVGIATTLRDASRSQAGGRGSSVLRAGLVAAQVALSIVLVAATSLLARSFVNAERVDPGVDAERIAVIGTNLFQAGVTTQEEAGAVADQILERIGALPGVETAALTTRLPLSNGPSTTTVVEGYESQRGTSALELDYAAVSRGYFGTMGIPLLAGRNFSAADRPESPDVVIVNETAARLFFEGDAVGRRIRPQDAPDAWREVIGVVADVKVTDLQEAPTPLLYFSSEQMGAGAFSVVVRADADPAALLVALPRALREVRDSLPVTRVDAFATYVASALEAARLSALLMGAFAGLALLLAGLGIYAAVSFSVERRTREIGIRVALGATAAQLIRMVVRGSLKAVGIGVVVGLVLAALATQGMQAILFGVAPLDPVSFAGAAALLFVAAGIAAFVPARRAVCGNPSDVIRSE
jgi:putative ABC transport system permease protein